MITAAALSEIPRLHLDAVDVLIGIDDIARFRHAARIDARSAMMGLVTAAVWQWKWRVAVSDAGEFGRKIGQLVGDEMHHLPFPLDAATHAEHGRRKKHAPEFLEHLDPDNDVGGARLVLHGEEHH